MAGGTTCDVLCFGGRFLEGAVGRSALQRLCATSSNARHQRLPTGHCLRCAKVHLCDHRKTDDQESLLLAPNVSMSRRMAVTLSCGDNGALGPPNRS